MGLGASGYIEIERIFLKFYSGERIIEKGSLTPEQGHRFFKKVSDEGKIGWEIIFERFPDMEFNIKSDIVRTKPLYLGPRIRHGSHPAYFKFQIAGRTILYQGKFYDLPEMRKKRR